MAAVPPRALDPAKVLREGLTRGDVGPGGLAAHEGVEALLSAARMRQAAGAVTVAELPGLPGRTAAVRAAYGASSTDGAAANTPAAPPSEVTAASEGAAARALDAEEFCTQGQRMVEFIVQYLEHVEDIPVRSTVQVRFEAREALHQWHWHHGSSVEGRLPVCRGTVWWKSSLVRLSAPSAAALCARIRRATGSHPCRSGPLAAHPYISTAIVPGLTHWQSPAFFAFFCSPTSAASICAHALISALNVVGFSWIAAPAATELETLVLDWLATLLGLPDGFHSVKSGGNGGGVIYATASEAGLVALLAARRWALDCVAGEGGLAARLSEAESRLLSSTVEAWDGRQGGHGRRARSKEGRLMVGAGPPVIYAAAGAAPASSAAGASAVGTAERGESASSGVHFPWLSAWSVARLWLVAYVSDQTHACVHKACLTAGLPEGNVRVLPITAASAYAITPEVLLGAMERDEAAGLIPFFLTLTVGTTSSTTFDPIAPLAAIAKAHGMWVHVDAAYAGMACMCPEMRYHLDGVHLVDSLASNAHKWLLTSFDCCCFWTQASGGGTLDSAGVFVEQAIGGAPGGGLQGLGDPHRPPLQVAQAVDGSAVIRGGGHSSVRQAPHGACSVV
ncbi:hypothetical protein CLOP_g7846 [Closterium sp. NIES-67]|nr:hypothetical protein CLOP_g7846 [Closterium sp. NIES-67]